MRRGRPARRRRGEPRPVAGAIDRVLERLGLGPVVEHHDVFREWADRVGPEIARAARPHRLDGDTLIVRVVHSAWLNELSLRQGELLERLNEGRRRSAVRRLIFRLDPEAGG